MAGTAPWGRGRSALVPAGRGQHALAPLLALASAAALAACAPGASPGAADHHDHASHSHDHEPAPSRAPRPGCPAFTVRRVPKDLTERTRSAHSAYRTVPSGRVTYANADRTRKLSLVFGAHGSLVRELPGSTTETVRVGSRRATVVRSRDVQLASWQRADGDCPEYGVTARGLTRAEFDAVLSTVS